MAEAELPYPPPTKGTPELHTLKRGRWWRVHAFDPASGNCPAHAFNGSERGNARFSPLTEGENIVPVLYAADTLAGALMETVLHDVPYPSEGYEHDLDRDLKSNLHASMISIRRDLSVVDLTKLGLQRMKIRPSQMFETNKSDYPRTRGWAHWLRQVLPNAQGFMWMSARNPESKAIVLFGDRIPYNAIARSRPQDSLPLQDPLVCEEILALLSRLGCGVAPNR